MTLDASASDIAEALDAVGFEVETIRRLDEGLNGVVVARVEGIEDHPEAERLRVCTVNHGATSEARVICGASNFTAGDLVAFAPVGAELPGGHRISARKIRGVVSEGMLCSEEELGIAENSEGILVISRRQSPPPLGMPITLALGLEDTVIDFDITPNRPDAMSVIGLAREAAAIFGSKLKIPEITLQEGSRSIEELINVENEAPQRCRRYMARGIEEVDIVTSPAWMSARLRAAGIRPINSIVDVTNYVLMECGQPLHAFDLAGLEENCIRVRMAEEGETITTLDGVDRRLTSDDLVIADASRPVALAGIMGGAGSEIRDDTRTVILESAYFDPAGILTTSKRLGLRSESSARFERGVDPEGVEWALNRAADLISALAGGTVARGAIDDYPVPCERVRISLRPERTNRILGTPLTVAEQSRFLESIEIAILEANEKSINALIPTFRPDLTREIDLIEEIGRLHGYDKIEPTLPRSSARIGGLSRLQRLQRRAAELLRGAGLSEIKTFSFVGPGDLLNSDADVARVANPLRAEESILRPSLIPGLIHVASFNAAHRRGRLRLFEVGRVFGPLDECGLPAESEHIAAFLGGEAWGHEGEIECDYLAIKGILDAFLANLMIDDVRLEPAERSGFHPGRTASIVIGGHPVGVIGELHPLLVADKGLGVRAAVFELKQELILEQVPDENNFRGFSRFPVALVDLAFVVRDEVPAADLEAAIREACGSHLESLILFDMYRGEQIAEGFKSLAYSLGFSSDDHTLSEEEITALREGVIAAARQQCGAELRSV